MAQNKLPFGLYVGKLKEPQSTEKLVDEQRRVTKGWKDWFDFVDLSLRRLIKLFTFLALEDTPDSYAGQTLKVVRVKADESGLEFAAPTSVLPAGGTTGQVLTKHSNADGDVDWENTAATYTDEQAQDAVGAMVDGTLVYVDATPLLTRAALSGDVTAPQGSNATTLANSGVAASTYGDATHVAQVTVDAKGRVTGASSVAISGIGGATWFPLSDGAGTPSIINDGAGQFIAVTFAP